MLDLNQERIVVTGGHGFLGRHLLAALEQRGVPARESSCPADRTST